MTYRDRLRFLQLWSVLVGVNITVSGFAILLSKPSALLLSVPSLIGSEWYRRMTLTALRSETPR